MNDQITPYTFKASRDGSGYDIMRRGSYKVLDHKRTRVRAEKTVGEMNTLLRSCASRTNLDLPKYDPSKPKAKRKRKVTSFDIPSEDIDYWTRRQSELGTETAINVEMSKKYGKSVSTMYRVWKQTINALDAREV